MSAFFTKGFTIIEVMIVVVIIGLLAMLAIPGFQRMRGVSQDKAVLNNARQLAAAAEQYYHETGESTVDLSSLVGMTNYVKSLDTVAKESYPNFFTVAEAVTVSGVAGQRTITYSP